MDTSNQLKSIVSNILDHEEIPKTEVGIIFKFQLLEIEEKLTQIVKKGKYQRQKLLGEMK